MMQSLLQEYKAHDKSRESIEMALDEILKQKMKIRHKYGFKPPKSGRRTDVEGDPTVSPAYPAYLVLTTQLLLTMRFIELRQHTSVNDGSHNRLWALIFTVYCAALDKLPVFMLVGPKPLTPKPYNL